MSKISDGGPAFPGPDEGHGWGATGMSLRAWLAGQALAGLAASWVTEKPGRHALAASEAVAMADATLALLTNEPTA